MVTKNVNLQDKNDKNKIYGTKMTVFFNIKCIICILMVF